MSLLLLGAGLPSDLPDAPVNSVLPSFTGTLTAGQTLTYVPGIWSGSPTLTHSWLSNGVVVGTGATLVTTAMSGTEITIGEVATNAGDSVSVESAAKYLFTNEAARALVARITAEPATLWKRAYDSAYSTSGFATALAKLDQFWIGSGPDSQSSLLDWCASRSLTVVGGMTQTLRQGWNTNGTTGILDSGVAHNAATKFLLNDASAFVYVFSEAGGLTDQGRLMGLNTATDGFHIKGNSSGNALMRINNVTEISGANSGVHTGLFTVVRTASNAAAIYLNTTQLATSANNSAGLQAANFIYFRSSSGTYAHTSVVLAAGGFGAKIDATDMGAIKGAIETFNTVSAPLNFLVVFSGQSLAKLLSSDKDSSGVGVNIGSGDGTAGSNTIDRVFIPELQTYLDAQFTTGRPNVITVLNTAVSGASLLPKSGQNSWWDPAANSGAGGAAYYATQHNTLIDGIGGASAFDHIIEIWVQGEAQASDGDTKAQYVEGMTGPIAATYTTGLIKFFRDKLGAGTKVIIAPLGRNTSATDANIKAIRDAQTEIVANVANTLLGPETSDTVRLADTSWHPVAFGASVNGFDRQAHWHARMAAFAFGCTVTYKGPEVASAAIVDATHTDVTLTYPAGCAGTDFTPTSGIVGFKVYDAGVSKAVSATVRTGATVIRLTHASVAGVRTVQYEPTQGALDRANMPRDNFATIAMPLRMSALLTAA